MRQCRINERLEAANRIGGAEIGLRPPAKPKQVVRARYRLRRLPLEAPPAPVHVAAKARPQIRGPRSVIMPECVERGEGVVHICLKEKCHRLPLAGLRPNRESRWLRQGRTTKPLRVWSQPR